MRGGQVLVVEMAALLRQDLVLKMDRACARFLEGPHRVHDVKRFAISGVGVDQQRQARCAHDLANEEGHLVYRDDAEIGQTHRCRHRGAGEIKRGETGRLGLKRGHPIMGARQPQDARLLQQGSKSPAGGFGRQICGDKIGHNGILGRLAGTSFDRASRPAPSRDFNLQVDPLKQKLRAAYLQNLHRLPVARPGVK